MKFAAIIQYAEDKKKIKALGSAHHDAAEVFLKWQSHPTADCSAKAFKKSWAR